MLSSFTTPLIIFWHLNSLCIIFVFKSLVVHSSAQVMCGHLLLLLAVLQVCSAIEYYVKPTEPPDTACPGQPCLTLNEYTNNTDYYIKSNTVFTFLPGKHHMDKPLLVLHKKNVTLKSTSSETVQPQLVPQFPSDVHCWDIEYLSTYAVGTYYDEYLRYERRKASVCCSALHLSNVSNAQIDNIQVVVSSS